MDSIAPKGTIWVCNACGKTTKDKMGIDINGWDESCFLHAVLCKEDTLKYDSNGDLRYAEATE